MMTSLTPHPDFSPRPGPVVLCIMDGVGLGLGQADDMVKAADTPNLSRLMNTEPCLQLTAHGNAVGLPTNQDMGNSEVGHNAMGAGRVITQGASLIENDLDSGAIWKSDTWNRLTQCSTLHLIGLCSDGNVHSHIQHLYALMDAAARANVQRLRIHVLTDGRDVIPRSALTYIQPLEKRLQTHREQGRDYCIASGGGRMHVTMDRYESDWSVVERGWRCHVHGEGQKFSSAALAIQGLYDQYPEINDQYLPPFVITNDAKEPVGKICDGDGVLFFNFRGDRAIQISRAFEDPTFPHFDRDPWPQVIYAGMMQYDGDLLIPKQYLVAPPEIEGTVGQYLATHKLRSFVVSETHKFGHVTYFFNGNRSGYIDPDLETYVEVPSRKGPLEPHPEMMASAITDQVIEAIESGKYHHIRLNYANGDMVGHTGNLEATRIAMEAVDQEIGRLEQAIRKAKGILLVTADHGNADEMWIRDSTGKVKVDPLGNPLLRTSHSLNPVPFILVDPEHTLRLRSATTQSGIPSIGSSILQLLGLCPPDHYAEGLIQFP